MKATTEIQVIDAARRTLDAVRRMRQQAALHAKPELRSVLDDFLAEDEALANAGVEELLAASRVELGTQDVTA